MTCAECPHLLGAFHPVPTAAGDEGRAAGDEYVASAQLRRGF